MHSQNRDRQEAAQATMTRRLTRLHVLLFLMVLCIGAWVYFTLLNRSYETPPNYSLIEDGIYLGGSLEKAPPGVDAVLNLCEMKDSFEAEVHLWEAIPDRAPAPDLKWLERMADFVEEQRTEGKTVFVHCFAGASRSATVLAAYYMRKNGWTRDEAIAFLREKRPQVRPNPAFMERLLEWEEHLAKIASPTP